MTDFVYKLPRTFFFLSMACMPEMVGHSYLEFQVLHNFQYEHGLFILSREFETKLRM